MLAVPFQAAKYVQRDIFYYLAIFDVLILKGFWLFPKLKLGNFCMLFHVILFRFSTSSLNLKTLGKEENHKNLNISRTKRPLLIRWKTFSIIFQGFLWWSIKKQQTRALKLWRELLRHKNVRPNLLPNFKSKK